MYWGGKPAKDLDWWQFPADWRRDDTHHKSWDGSDWETEKKVKKGKWRDYGRSDDGLCYRNLNNDVTLNDSARADQRLLYRYHFYAGGKIDKLERPGAWHEHYLE